MVTVFFLFVGTTHHSSPYVEGGPELNLPTSRSQYLEVSPPPLPQRRSRNYAESKERQE